MSLPPPQRIQQIQAPMVPLVAEWIARHPGTISLGQGVVHYSPPDGVAAAVAQAVASDPRVGRYGPYRGIPEFLAAVEHKLEVENQIHQSAEQLIVTTTGSNMAFQHAVFAIADPGDEIILLSPYYFNHEMAITLAGCRPVCVATQANYHIDFELLEQAISPRTRAIVTVSPNNPTGAVYPSHDLQRVNQLCQQQGLFHISDEAYEYFVDPPETHFSPASLATATPFTISLFSLSKAYGMAGWRVGYMVVPRHLESALRKIQDTILVCPPIVNQLAGAAALAAGHSWCRERISQFAEIRQLVYAALERLGARCQAPPTRGAFYVLARIDSRHSDVALVERLIREHGVAVMPGSTFGIGQGCVIRIAFGALARDTVAEGLGRLVRGLQVID